MFLKQFRVNITGLKYRQGLGFTVQCKEGQNVEQFLGHLLKRGHVVMNSIPSLIGTENTGSFCNRYCIQKVHNLYRRNLHAQQQQCASQLQQKLHSLTDYSMGTAYIHIVYNDDEWLHCASHLWLATPMVGTQLE